MDSPAFPHQSQPTPDWGKLGEDLVAQWLRSQGWTILHQRWICKLGELDIVARMTNTELAFVEVKTRSQGNWDSDGLLAITPNKQTKLWKSAQLFLLQYPELSELPCRFDVAIVKRHPLSYRSQVKFSRTTAGYQLTLQHYIPNAFTF